MMSGEFWQKCWTEFEEEFSFIIWIMIYLENMTS